MNLPNPFDASRKSIDDEWSDLEQTAYLYPAKERVKSPELKHYGLELESDVDISVLGTWIGNGLSFASLGCYILLRFEVTPLHPIGVILIGIAVLMWKWAIFRYYYNQRRHWTSWVLLPFLVAGIICLLIVVFFPLNRVSLGSHASKLPAPGP